MARGGIYDQIGCGFHRYSTDSQWLVPHFEKMLYDNALLSRLYLHYYQVTKDEWARNIVEGILDYVVREMLDSGGGFYSTQDADSEGHEGKFFVWTASEIREGLGQEDADLFCLYYNVSDGGNFDGKNILNVTRSVEEIALAEKVSVQELSRRLSTARQKLFTIRETRIKPHRDEKVLTAWNGLMVASFAEAAATLDREDYRVIAGRNSNFILENLRRNGLLLRSYKDGQAKLNAYLEDYAFYLDGLLCLYETTGRLNWFREAINLADKMIEEFWDAKDGGFFFTGSSHEQLIVRSKDTFDNATPAGNSVAADQLLRLSILSGNSEYQKYAVTILRLAAEQMRRFPSGFGRTLCALDFYLSSPKEIAVIGNPTQEETKSLLRQIWQEYLPNKVVAQGTVDDPTGPSLIPLLQDRRTVNNTPTAYVCENYVCREPTTDPERLLTLISP